MNWFVSIICTPVLNARTMLDNWSRYVEEFIQVTPIEYKKVLAEEQMRKLQQKIAEVQRDY